MWPEIKNFLYDMSLGRMCLPGATHPQLFPSKLMWNKRSHHNIKRFMQLPWHRKKSMTDIWFQIWAQGRPPRRKWNSSHLLNRQVRRLQEGSPHEDRMFLHPKGNLWLRITRPKEAKAPSPKKNLCNLAQNCTMMVCFLTVVVNECEKQGYSSTCQYWWQAWCNVWIYALQKHGSACLLSSARPTGFCGTGKASPLSCPLPSRAKLSHSMVNSTYKNL